MRTRVILTAMATVSAALSSAVLVAPAASALGSTMPPTPPAPGVPDALDVANNWCVAPLRLAGPAATNIIPGEYRVCDDNRVGGDGGVHVLDNLCVAPVQIDGPLATGVAPYEACNDEVAAGPGPLGPVSVLRNASVLGVQVTH